MNRVWPVNNRVAEQCQSPIVKLLKIKMLPRLLSLPNWLLLAFRGFIIGLIQDDDRETKGFPRSINSILIAAKRKKNCMAMSIIMLVVLIHVHYVNVLLSLWIMGVIVSQKEENSNHVCIIKPHA